MADINSDVHKKHRIRMKKRFLEHGFENFAEHEILEFLLFYSISRQDTNPLAHRILDEYKTLANVFDADPSDLAKIDGMGEHSAILIKMIRELFPIYQKSKCERKVLLHDTDAIGRFALSHLDNKLNEEFLLICLDSNRYVHWSGIIEKGTIDKIVASPRIIVAEAIKHNAKTVAFAHNHPNGTILPSEADRKATRIICDALKYIGVKTVDHIIVAQNRYYSLSETGFTF